MGQTAATIGAAALPSLIGLLTGGGGNKFASYPGSDQTRDAMLNALLGENPYGGSYWRQSGAPQGTGMNLLSQLAGLGAGTSALQRSGVGGQPGQSASPEMQTWNLLMPTLQGIATNNTAASGLNALRPVYQQNLNQASNQLTANAPGGRFSSGMLQAQGNLQQRSLNDFNLLANNMMQQGFQNQMTAANTMGSLGSQAGSAQMQALQMLLGPMLGPAFGGTIMSQPSGLQQGMQAGGSLAQLMMLMQMLNRGGATGGATGGTGVGGGVNLAGGLG